MRFFSLFLVIAFLAMAFGQLGAAAPGLTATAPAGNAGAPRTSIWDARKQEDGTWGKSYDNWKKARDDYNASP